MTHGFKQRVRQAFARAADSYDSAAEVQRRICEGLLTHLTPGLDAASGTTPRLCLDAGCGTGYGLTRLAEHIPEAKFLALDVAHPMLARLPRTSFRCQGDIEALPLASASIDLYWSSLSLQWCDAALAMAEARRVLSDSGVLAIASLGPDTFRELRLAFRTVDTHAHTHQFVSASEAAAQARAAGFSTVDVFQHREMTYYPDFKTLLTAVKAIGANQIAQGRRPGLLGRHAFATAAQAFEPMRQAAGLPLTYDVFYLIARP